MKNIKICVIGLGYVGLPIAVEFAKNRIVIGFDINKKRISELINKIDSTLETSNQELSDAIYLSFTSNPDEIKDCGIYIVTVPTPIDEFKKPNLDHLKKASEIIGKVLKKSDIVIY